jgi:hypothetical protein
VVPASVKSFQRIWISGQGSYSYTNGAHAVLVSQVTAR